MVIRHKAASAKQEPAYRDMPATASREAENLSCFIEAVEVFNHTQERDMEAKHTPGPWAFGGEGPRPHHRIKDVYVSGQDDAGISLGFAVTSDPDKRAEYRANARLIAAAPELLEALQLIADTDPIDAALDPQRAVRVARAAIAKAIQ